MNKRKEVLHDTRHILGDIDPLSGYKPWGRLYVLFEKLFIDTVKEYDISSINLDSEEQKLALATSDGKLSRLIN